MKQAMTPFSANPFVFIFAGVMLIAAIGYFGWGALDRLGLAEEQATAVVTGKQYNPPGVTYRTNIVGGRAYTMADSTSETYALTLTIDREPTIALVSKELFNQLKAGDQVQVRLHRTRFSRQLEVTEVLH